MLGSVYYAGWCSSVLWVPSYADKYGRVWFFKFGMVVNTILFAVLILSRSYILTLVTIAVLGFFSSFRTGVGWPYLLEVVPKQDRSIHTALFGMLGALQGIIGAFYFSSVSHNAYLFMGIGFFM